MRGDELAAEIVRLNGVIGKKGCRVLVMRPGAERSLVYLYRARNLRAVLAQRAAAEFLRGRGYRDLTVEGAIAGLRFALVRLLQRWNQYRHKI